MFAKRAAIYLMVSPSGPSGAAQPTEPQEYCTHRGWSIAEQYVDQTAPDAKVRRPALDRLMADAALRRFDVVVVACLHQFAHSIGNLLGALEELRAHGIDFVSVAESVDTSTPANVLAVVAAIAKMEQTMIRERVRAGIRLARARGKRLGRPQVSLDPNELSSLRAEGLSYEAISKKLGVSKASVCRRCNESKNDVVSEEPFLG